MFVSIKPLHVSVFFHDHPKGVLRCALCRYYPSRRFAFGEFVLLRSMWPHVYVICVCLVFLSVGDVLHKQITNRQEHQTHIIFVANFLRGLFMYQTQKPEQDDTSGVATPATLKVLVLSTVFEIPRWYNL